MSTTTSYYGGSTVFDGRVRKLNASSFAELVTRYVNVPVSFPLTRKEFWALPEKERNRRKDCAYICCCGYDFEEGHRDDASATTVNLVVLDLDEGPFIKDFDQAPDTLTEHLYPLNFVCWRSASYTPEKPRLKIMVEVSPCDPGEHRRFVRYIADRLGLPYDFKGARESGVLSQPQYRPLAFRGEEDESAVIKSKVDGIALHLSDLPDLDEEMTEMIEGRRFACDRWEDDDALGLAYLPVPGLTVEDIREPLYAISPDCGYLHWTWVACGLRAQFIEEEEAEEAYGLFLEWSATGVSFLSDKDCFTKWKSFKPYKTNRAPITIRSLFKLAQDSGRWVSTKLAAKVAQTVQEWLASCNSKDELMQEGASRIAAMPFKNEVVYEDLVISWQARIKAVSNTHIDKATLKKEVHRTIKREAAAKQENREDSTPSWLRPICYVATLDAFYNFGTGFAFKPASFDRFFEQKMMPKDGGEVPANGRPILSPSAYALNLMNIPRVEETIYNPTRHGEDSFYEMDGRSYLNTYKPGSVPIPDPTHAERAGALITKHAAILIAEPELQGFFLDFLAHLVQRPGEKVLWAFIIQSAPGAGKGTLGEIMKKVLGSPNTKSISPRILTSGFTEWAKDCVLCILEEVHMTGEIREKVMNDLKTLITDPVVSLSVKHSDAKVDVPNFVNYLAFTNKRDSLHLTDSDRRWCVIQSPLQTKQHILDLNATGHFGEDQMQWLKTEDGASALRYWLSKREISKTFPVHGPAPVTKYRDAIVEESKNPMQLQIEDLIEDAVSPYVTREVIHMGHLVEHVARNNHSLACRVPVYLAQMGFEKYGPERVLLENVRGAIYTSKHFLNGIPPVDFLKRRAENFEDGFA